MRIDQLKTPTYRRTISIGGSRLENEPVFVELINSSLGHVALTHEHIEVHLPSPTRWSAVLHPIDPGVYQVTIGSSVAQGRVAGTVSEQIEVLESQPHLVNLQTPLDGRGELAGFVRDPGESLRQYRDLLRDFHINQGSRSMLGMVRNLSRALRLDRAFRLTVLTSDSSTQIRIEDDCIDWTCNTYTKQQQALVDSSTGRVMLDSKPARVFRVMTLSDTQVEWSIHEGQLLVESGELEQVRVSYQYWKSICYVAPGLTLGQLLTRLNTSCLHSEFIQTTATGSCSKGIGRTGWPARFLDEMGDDQYHPCANGTCPLYQAHDPVRWGLAEDWIDEEFITDPQLLNLPAIGLIATVPIQFSIVRDGLWRARILYAPVAIKPIANERLRLVLGGKDFLQSPLFRLQEQMRAAFRNLWGSAELGSVAPLAASAAIHESIVPTVRMPQRVSPDLFQSGVDMEIGPRFTPKLLEDGRWEGHLTPGYFWHGPNQYYLYANKTSVSLADCATLDIIPHQIRWQRSSGQDVSEQPGVIGFGSVQLVEVANDLNLETQNLYMDVSPSGNVYLAGKSFTEDRILLFLITLQGQVELLSSFSLGQWERAGPVTASSDSQVWFTLFDSPDTHIFLWDADSLTEIQDFETQIDAAHLSKDNLVILAGTQGKVLEYDGSWSETQLPGNPDLHAAVSDGDQTAWVFGDDGQIWHKDSSLSEPAWTQQIIHSQITRFHQAQRTRQGLFVLGEVKSSTGRGGSTALLRWDSVQPLLELILTFDDVDTNDTLNLSVHGMEATLTVSASTGHHRFQKGANLAALTENLANALRSSSLGPYISVIEHTATGLIEVRPVGGRIDPEHVLGHSWIVSDSDGIEVFSTHNSGSWIIEEVLEPVSGNPYTRLLGRDAQEPQADEGRALAVRTTNEPGIQWSVSFVQHSDDNRHISAQTGRTTAHLTGTAGALRVHISQDNSPVNLGRLEKISAARVLLKDVLIASEDIISGPGLIRIALGPVLAQNPGLWESLVQDDELALHQVRTQDGRSWGDFVIPLRSVHLRFRLPSEPIDESPIIITNNMIRREDTFGDKTELFSKESFFVDDQRWIHFSRSVSLLYNPGFEIVSEQGDPDGWRFVDDIGSTITQSSLARRVTTTQIESVAFRGEASVFLSPTHLNESIGLETQARIEPSDVHTLSAVIRKGRIAEDQLTDTQSLALFQFRVIPLNAQGSELDWPAEIVDGHLFSGWSRVQVTTNRWARYSFSFGYGIQRLPKETRSIKVQIWSLGAGNTQDGILVDAVNLEANPVATDLPDRPRGFGDDLTIEYGEPGQTHRVVENMVFDREDNQVPVDFNPVISVWNSPTVAIVPAVTSPATDDWEPFYDPVLLEDPRPLVARNKSLHRAAVPYAASSGMNKLRWLGSFGPSNTYEELTSSPGTHPQSASVLEVNPIGPLRVYRRHSDRIYFSVLVRQENGRPAPERKITAELIVGASGRLLYNDERHVEITAKTDENGIAVIGYQVPPPLPYKWLKVENSGSQLLSIEPDGSLPVLTDVYANEAPEGLLGQIHPTASSLHNYALAKLVDDDGDEISSTPLYQVVDGVVSPFMEDPLFLEEEIDDAGQTPAPILDGSTVQNGRLSKYVVHKPAIRRSVKLTIGDSPQQAVNSLEECFKNPNTFFVEYHHDRFSIFYHTSTSKFMKVQWLRQFLFIVDEDGQPLPPNQIRFEPEDLGLEGDTYLRIEPDLKETIRFSVDGGIKTSRLTRDVTIINTLAPSSSSQTTPHSVRDLSINFHRQVGTDLEAPLPGSGDSLRVVFSWRNAVDMTQVTSYEIQWQASGPTGFYHQYPASMEGPDQAGSNLDPYKYLNGSTDQWTFVSNGDPIPANQNWPRNEVIVRWPGDEHLDDTLEIPTVIGSLNEPRNILINRLTAFAGASQAGEPIVWEGGGIDNAVYRVTVRSMDAQGRVLGESSVETIAPDLTPPQPPEVFPDEQAHTIELTLDSTHSDIREHRGIILRPGDQTDHERIFRELVRTGAVRVQIDSGAISVETASVQPVSYMSAVRIRKVINDRTYEHRIIGAAGEVFDRAEAAQFHAMQQHGVIHFSQDEIQAGVGLIISLPTGITAAGGSLSLSVRHAQKWIEQAAQEEPKVIVRAQQRRRLTQSMATGLMTYQGDRTVEISHDQ